jgi:hypothetical protein
MPMDAFVRCSYADLHKNKNPGHRARILLLT